MPSLVPMHSVIVSRPHPKGLKDKNGDPIHVRTQPKVGEPFDFTDEEAEDLKASGHDFREPVNEGGALKDADAAENAALLAQEEAQKAKTAALDAANTARSGAKGRGKLDKPQANASEDPGTEEEEL